MSREPMFDCFGIAGNGKFWCGAQPITPSGYQRKHCNCDSNFMYCYCLKVPGGSYSDQKWNGQNKNPAKFFSVVLPRLPNSPHGWTLELPLFFLLEKFGGMNLQIFCFLHFFPISDSHRRKF